MYDIKHNSEKNDWLNSPVSTGTTIMAIEFNGGVICGADSRTSMGSFVSNRFADKITPVTDNIFCLRSGSAADTQAISDVAQYYLSVYEMETNELPAVGVAANVFKNMCYKYRDQLLASIIVAGYDNRLGGQVYSVPPGGLLVKQPFAIGGSGSGYIYGYVDANFKENMSKDECIKFVVDAISLAIKRDGSSGGVVRMAIITKDGVERLVFTEDQFLKPYEA